MKNVYFKPKLYNLSQGNRIAFVRQIRKMTQNEVSLKLGLTGESKRRSMTRYERGDRIPKIERLQEIADILNVNVKCLKQYDFTSNEDIIYVFFWMEELYPRMTIDFPINESNKSILKFMNEWDIMRKKRINKEITYNEYIEWKLQYEFNEGVENEDN